ncbi:hypothetical protein [Fimbriiglobus ruber]|uniref:Ribose ABC transport system, periplasmic ribose-binding protein RbsB n=1 Tax=Fimbriiglobus ruber TaxID=1908690 RepID=A0A225DXW6_9BACT|nr:hypothetical protein [Fimbriiglobus ruber]OWK46380.1 Ribose ABC transport system, periplasmic ribose-binding protein RbsB [Fimbriiglobus ruber]
MIFSLWKKAMRFKTKTIVQKSSGNRTSTRLSLEPLTDRLAPSASPFWLTSDTSDTATHFLVITPESTQVGATTPIEVVALDASNRPVSNYTGTVHFTSSDGSATLPADYTFTSDDHGFHLFTETPSATGSETITATDTTTASITGSASVTVDGAQVATHFAVIARSQAEAGQSSDFIVVALDANNRRVADYTGTVTLTTSDSAGTLSASTYTFTADDRGAHEFTATLATTGSQTITATDSTTSSITGSATVNVNAAPTATHLIVVSQPSAYANEPTKIVVAALDASNHIVTNYTGTVSFTSTGSSDSLPANYTFTSSDNGYHVFTVTPSATGSDTITATDTTTSSITGSTTISVNATQVATHFAVVAQGRATTGTATQFAVVALDMNNQPVQNYTGTVHFTTTDTATGASVPADYTFTADDQGVHVFTATFATSGTQTITATDTTTSTLTGTASIRVSSGSSSGLGNGGPLGGGPFSGWRW